MAICKKIAIFVISIFYGHLLVSRLSEMDISQLGELVLIKKIDFYHFDFIFKVILTIFIDLIIQDEYVCNWLLVIYLCCWDYDNC